MKLMEPHREKTNKWILTRSDKNQAGQPLKVARGLKFRIKEVEVLYYPSSENQGPVNLDYVVWNIKGSMSCTDIPFNDSNAIINYHLLAISNGLITCLVSVLYYHLPVDADNQYRSAGVLHFIYMYLTILSVFVFVFNQNSYSNTLYLYYGIISYETFLKKLHYGLLL